MLRRLCRLRQVARWMSCLLVTDWHAEYSCVPILLLVMPSSMEDRTEVLLSSRWLEAAAVSAGKERLNFLTLHVVEVRSGPGLGSGIRLG